jgi:hypothetical protein
MGFEDMLESIEDDLRKTNALLILAMVINVEFVWCRGFQLGFDSRRSPQFFFYFFVDQPTTAHSDTMPSIESDTNIWIAAGEGKLDIVEVSIP